MTGPTRPVDRITTGIPELDKVLSGGVPANSINILMGLPGTGKTILAEQIMFANASVERPGLFLSTLAEPLEKFVAHGQTYRFFDSSRVGKDVYYEDLAASMRDRGLASLTDVVGELVARRRPRVVVIDSFKALSTLHAAEHDRRQILFDFASMLSTLDSTTFLVGEYAPDTMGELPEFAIADAVFQLMKYQSGMREQRFIRVEKLRGSGYVSGMHSFRIGRAGLEVFPRLLTPKVSPTYENEVERLSSGIEGLDRMIDKGFWRGTTSLVAGPSGSGKTSIALQFVAEGAERGEPGLYVGFQENPVQLARALANFGRDPRKLLEDPGLFEHLYCSPVEMQLDEVVLELFRRVRERNIRRVAIDSLADLKRSSFDPQRYMEYMYALVQWFAVEGVTSVMTYEIPHLFEAHLVSEEQISNVSDNIVLLRFSQGQPMERTLRIIKTRNSGHDHAERVLRIHSAGLSVGDLVRAQ